jgi:hypothetical protein
LALVAARALEVMHYRAPPKGQPWSRDTLTDDLDDRGQPWCEAGCYRCLLSYYNQPDHGLIDRKDREGEGQLLDLLCRLTRAHSRAPTTDAAAAPAATTLHPIEQRWLEHVSARGHRLPDRQRAKIADLVVPFLYRDLNLVVWIDAADTPAPADLEDRLEAVGHFLLRFPADPASWADLFRQNADLFGQGTITPEAG